MACSMNIVKSIRCLIWTLLRKNYSECHNINTYLANYEGLSVLERKLLDVFKQYQKILHFISISSNGSLIKAAYLRSFISGFQDIQAIFHSKLIDLEKTLLWYPSSTPLDALEFLQNAHTTFLKINQIIEQITDFDLKGCKILELCKKVEFVSPFEELNLRCLVLPLERVMLKMIKYWVLYGELYDPCEEFFIIGYKDEVNSSPMVSMDSSVFNDMIKSTSVPLPLPICTDYKENLYQIDVSKIPDFLPYSLVNKMLMVGKYLIILKHAPSKFSSEITPCINVSDFGMDEKILLSKFKMLENDTSLDLFLLENIVDDILLALNKYLRKLVDDVSDFSGQFRILTDLYLMGRGELFKEFLKRADYLLSADAWTVRSNSLNTVLENAAYDLYGSDNIKFLDRFHFSLPPKKLIPRASLTRNLIKLNYKTPWPLHLMFPQEILDAYNRIFLFLIQLKTAHGNLMSIWQETSSFDHSYQDSFAQLRHRLCILITNLQDYIFVDVILSEKSKFEHILKSAETFNEIQLAHATFVSNMMCQMFLLPGCEIEPVSHNTHKVSDLEQKEGLVQKQFKNLFSLIQRYCWLVKAKDMDSSMMIEKFDLIESNFNTLIKDIMSLVNKISEKYSLDHVNRLLLQLDYNNYFSQYISGM